MHKGECDGCSKVTFVNRSHGARSLVTKAVILAGDYCADCFEKHGLDVRQRRHGVAGPAEDDGGPFQQNAVREMEDATGFDTEEC